MGQSGVKTKYGREYQMCEDNAYLFVYRTVSWRFLFSSVVNVLPFWTIKDVHVHVVCFWIMKEKYVHAILYMSEVLFYWLSRVFGHYAVRFFGIITFHKVVLIWSFWRLPVSFKDTGNLQNDQIKTTKVWLCVFNSDLNAMHKIPALTNWEWIYMHFTKNGQNISCR